MKKFLLLMVVAVSSLAANAQYYVGGEVGAWRNSDDNHTTFTLAPEFGFGLSDKWAIGLSFAYGHEYFEGVKQNSVAVDPYARWSYAKFGPVSLFLDMGFGVAAYKLKDADDSQVAWRVGVQPGVNVTLTKQLSFVAHVGYLGYRNADDGISPYGEQGFGFNLSGNDLTFGLYYNF